jgi:uncharacterized protein
VDRLFLDANVLFSAAYLPNAGVERLWHLSETALFTSGYAIEEARRNLANESQLQRFRALLDTVASVPAATLEPALRKGIALPEKDWPILNGAVAAQATHLITGDVRHFGRHFGERLLGILVLPPGRYLRSRHPG